MALACQTETRARPILDGADLDREQVASFLSSQAAESDVGLPFAESAKRVMGAARDEADALEDDEIAPEHFLLGLLHERGTVVGDLLAQHGLHLEAVRKLLQ